MSICEGGCGRRFVARVIRCTGSTCRCQSGRTPSWKSTSVPCRASPLRRTSAGIGRSPARSRRLLPAYYRTPAFANLAPITRRTYRNDMERFRREHGDRRVAALTRDHIERLIALKADRPAAANRLRKTLKILMAHAVKTKMRRGRSDQWREEASLSNRRLSDLDGRRDSPVL